MSHFLSRGLLKILLILLSLDGLGQADSTVVSKNEKGRSKADTVFPGSIKIAANPTLKGTRFSRTFMGSNYREEWITPIKVDMLNLNTAYGGLVPTKMGGGKQTKSLRVEDQSGREWSLRSVEKFPEKAIPPTLRKTLAEKIVEEGISGSYPYGVLSMAALSHAANVLYLKDSLVYVPDDPALGEFRLKFRNTLALMEEREPSGFIGQAEKGKKEKTINTQELVYKLSNENDHSVDQSAVLRARLLDNFVMDFDRHQRQWDWLGVSTSDGKVYYPVPVDRDQAFYHNRSFIGKLLSGKNFIPQIQGFREKDKDPRTFNKAAQSFDRYFLNSLSEEDWSRQTDEFISAMRDDVIEDALHKQPAEIQNYSVEKIITTLKNKRQYFKDDMMKYYKFLSKTVSITGTNDRDQFVLSSKGEGKINVVVNKIDSAGNVAGKIYERTFDPTVTKELRIYGLEGDDKFIVQDLGGSSIKIRIIGGPGRDEFVNTGNNRKATIYDVSFEQNSFSGDGTVHKKISADPQNNEYTRLDYLYDKHGLGLAVEYSIGGWYVGPQLKLVKQEFRKDPYGSSQLLSVTRAINIAAYHLKYYAEFIKLIGKTDLVFHGDAWLPSARTFFFGMGNNSVFDKSQPGQSQYYLANYQQVSLSLMGRTKINSWLQFRYGPVYQYFKLNQKANQDKYIATIYPPTENDQGRAYSGKSYGGGEVNLEINTRNNEVLPTRGVRLNIYGRSVAGLSKHTSPIAETGGQLNLYTDFISKKHVVLATSIGGNHIAGNFEFEQAQYLGFLENLRGFRIDRFAGRSKVYNNSEIRFIKPDANLGLFRGSIGFFLFNDVGRVWADNESSNQWHDGYGWGVFVTPLDRVMLAATLMYSKEEKNLLFVNFAFQF